LINKGWTSSSAFFGQTGSPSYGESRFAIWKSKTTAQEFLPTGELSAILNALDSSPPTHFQTMKTLASTFAIASFGFAIFSGCNMPQFSSKRDFQKVIPINSQVNVIAETFNGSITVSPADQSEVELVAHIKAYGYTQDEADAAVDSLTPEIDTTASALTIACKRRNQTLTYSDSVSLELKVPAGWPLILTTSNGSVSTTQSRGPVTINTSNGKIEVKESAGSLQLATSNGKIVIENSAGNVQASSSNGAVELTNCSLEGKCKLGTSNGKIKVSFSDRTPMKLDASTSNGLIQFIEADADLTKKSKTHITGILFGKANGPVPTVSLELETSNGTITISTDSASSKPTSTESVSVGLSK